MDERHAKITEGAGLEESKLNTEFIDWLRKWSTPILLVIAVVVGGYGLYKRMERAKAEKVQLAFDELNAVIGTPNIKPESLTAIADSYEGIKAVASIARLAAADRHLELVRKGIEAGAVIAPDGTVPAEEALTEAERSRHLDEAARLYQMVLTKETGTNGRALQAMGAAYGLAAVAESRGQMDQAKAAYERVIEIAKYAGFEGQEQLATKRIETLGEIAGMPKLYAKAELPQPPAPPAPPAPTGSTPDPNAPLPPLPTLEVPASTGEPGATGSTGSTGATGPTGGEPAPTGTPAPTGEPPAIPPAPK